MQTHQNLASAYHQQYASGTTAWRETGAKFKVQHMQTVSEGKTYQRLLEVGAGDGAVLASLEEAGFAQKLFAVEISASGIAQIESRKLKTLESLELFDGYVLPYPDKFFDVAVCTHVLEHVEHPRLLLREIKRVSAAQIFEVPIDFSWRVDKKLHHFLGYGHINIFTPATFRFLLRSEGFDIIKDLHSITATPLWRLEAAILKQKLPPLGYYKWYILNALKRNIWHFLPAYLKDRKPNAYTVYCQASSEEIKIF